MVPNPKAAVLATSAVRAFSEAEYTANASSVVAHAAETGTAIVSASDGRALVVISIPTVDLPTLDD